MKTFVVEYQDRVYAANDVVIVLDDDIVRYTLLQARYHLSLAYIARPLPFSIFYRLTSPMKGKMEGGSGLATRD